MPDQTKRAEELLGEWLRRLCHGTPDDVVNMYTEDGILIGTVAESIKRGRPAIKTYFDTFMDKENLCGEVTSMEVQSFAKGGVVSGTYTFKWEENGKPEEVNARYSYVFKESPDGTMRIVNHHSSAQPESNKDADSEVSALF
jgi:hypothetical protein